MRFTDRLYREVNGIWESFYCHPFIVGIGNGSLEIEKFKFFMVQDYLYLLQYAKVFALGVVKAQNEADMRFFAQNTESILNGEMKLHKAYMRRLYIAENQLENAKMSLVNRSYTSYMTACAFEGGIADIAAAVLACSWSYAEIGRRLNDVPNTKEHPIFGEWVKSYSSEEYQRQNVELINFMNRLTEGFSEERLRHLSGIFVNCSRFEAEFWNMAWNMEE